MFLDYFALGVLIAVFLIFFTALLLFMIFPIYWPRNASILTRMQFMSPAG